LHPDVERYCPVIPDAGLLRQGEQAEHSPARQVVQHSLVHWPAHALHCFPVAQVVQHSPVHWPAHALRCFPAALAVQHSPVHWLAHALRCFPAAQVVPHSLVHGQFPVLRRALLAARVAPVSVEPLGRFSPEAARDVKVPQPGARAGSELWAGGLRPPAGSSLAVKAQLARYVLRPSRSGVAAGYFSPRHA
jgi:hypothetical protein